MPVNGDRKNMLIALFGSTLISFAPLFYQYSETNPVTGAFFRMAYALPVLILLIFLLNSKDTRSRESRSLTLFAGLLISLDFVGYHTAIDYIGTGIATMIGNSQVIIVTLVSWKFLGEKPNKVPCLKTVAQKFLSAKFKILDKKETLTKISFLSHLSVSTEYSDNSGGLLNRILVSHELSDGNHEDRLRSLDFQQQDLKQLFLLILLTGNPAGKLVLPCHARASLRHHGRLSKI